MGTFKIFLMLILLIASLFLFGCIFVNKDYSFLPQKAEFQIVATPPGVQTFIPAGATVYKCINCPGQVFIITSEDI